MRYEAPEINPVSQTRTGSRTLSRSIRVSLAVLAMSASVLIPLAPETSIAYAGETPQKGDLNRDGRKDREDLQILKKVVRSWEKYESRPHKSDADSRHYWPEADINGDRRIDKKDVEALKKILTK